MVIINVIELNTFYAKVCNDLCQMTYVTMFKISNMQHYQIFHTLIYAKTPGDA